MKHAPVLMAMACLFGTTGVGTADDVDRQASVEAGRQALDRWQDYIWYDDAQDDVARIDVRAPRQPPDRPWLWDVIRGIGWLTLAMLIGWISYLMWRSFRNRGPGKPVSGERRPAGDPLSEADRVEALPFAVRRPRSNLLTEAENHYRQGNWNEAMIYLYSHLLVQLDQHQVIHLVRSKTNRQYLRETKRNSSAGEILQLAMVAFEEVFFGRRNLSRTRFEACWDRLDEFARLIERGAQTK